ncbi:MAG TPA: hypothetical protein PLJ00_01490 [Chitinophagales bacterium]|nr:hypothetical protein [Chitinophagales bacterium]HRG84809.1 hypothetical protein [Chitinophagales bacterium]HRH51854.1 hypothetical protein [Chitinophagales bacterium]
MNSTQYWKNFSLGTEIDISGAFIYNGLKAFDDIQYFIHEAEIFEVLYNLSVGIERLCKVAIVLIEYNSSTDSKRFTESIKTHKIEYLIIRVTKNKILDLNKEEKAFINLLSHFYNSLRYDRYSENEQNYYTKEKEVFVNYLNSELKFSIDIRSDFILTENDSVIKSSFGKVVGNIVTRLYEIIRNEAVRLHLYTYEIREFSKARKIFYSEKFDFLEEACAVKELLIFFINNKNSNGVFNIIRNIKPLDLDPALANDYIQALIHPHMLQEHLDEIEANLEDVLDKSDRIEVLELLSNLRSQFDDGDEEEID